VSGTADSEQYWEALGPDAPADVLPVVATLRHSTPRSNPGFRGELGRALQDTAARLDPARDRMLIAVCAAIGCVLIIMALISAAGVGPLS
jgi:hypothetical protein